jgi:hypothetical protein
MNLNNFTEQIGNLIAKDELSKAIGLLKKLLDKSPKLDEAIIQSARFNDIMKQVRLGVVDFEQANITKNKIRYAVLDLLRDMEESVESNSEIRTEIENLKEEIIPPSIGQFHYGSGDNIAGDKIINK